ncbi:hypothetical protein KCP69_04840 [Salmonella enterica subsp. enterica]|nr:hypothetical protein KCP69_04840 [Salmonella enterica subsp. enterica]
MPLMLFALASASFLFITFASIAVLAAGFPVACRGLCRCLSAYLIQWVILPLKNAARNLYITQR